MVKKYKNNLFILIICLTEGNTKSYNCERSDEDGISKKEYSIIVQIAEGLSNKEIADLLYLSEGTIRNYISVILEKLDLRDRTQIAIYYYRNQITPFKCL